MSISRGSAFGVRGLVQEVDETKVLVRVEDVVEDVPASVPCERGYAGGDGGRGRGGSDGFRRRRWLFR